MNDETLPVVSVDDLDGERDAARVHGVLLAAGTSSRFGDANKLLATVEGEPIVRHAADAFIRSILDGTTVVVGHEADRIRDALDGLDVNFEVNESYRRGQSTSVRAGVLEAIDRNADAVVIGLGDMPDVSIESVNRLVEAYERDAGDALAAAYEGERGNPVLFDADHFDALANVSGDVGGRKILFSSPDAALIETGDPGVLRDVDLQSDLRAVRNSNQ